MVLFGDSFWTGFARSLDMYGGMNRSNRYAGFANAWDADRSAFDGDWRALGSDFDAVANNDDAWKADKTDHSG